MKKIVLLAGILLSSLTLSAQEETGYKAKAGDITVDLALAGGLGNTTVNLADQGFGNGAMFKARYFQSDKLALRALLFAASSNTTDNSVLNTESKTSSTGFGIGFGLEKHFTGTDRLATYVGGDAIVAFNSQKDETTVVAGGLSTVTTVKGPNDFRFGVRGVFGAEYYIVKHVYLGVEAGLGLYYQKNGDTTTSVTGSPDVTIDGGNSFNITPAIVTGIRLGYTF